MAVFQGNGLVWKGKVIAKFVDGQCQTEDTETIATLKKMGYECIEEKKKAPRKGDSNGHSPDITQ